jgi:hypothetical protein
VTGPALLPGWTQLEKVIPQITVPMRRYPEQVACVLRPGSVSGTDQALRSFTAFLAETSLATPLAQVTRRHVEAFKQWLAARPGRTSPGHPDQVLLTVWSNAKVERSLRRGRVLRHPQRRRHRRHPAVQRQLAEAGQTTT